MNVVCITSKNSVGCSFVDWSINFLSGNNTYFNVKQSEWVKLSNNPINKYNAHGHEKNHPSGLTNTIEYIDTFLKNPTGMHTMYPFPLHVDSVCQLLGIDYNHLNTPDLLKLVQQRQHCDYVDLINYCIDHSVKVIYVHSNYQSVGYSWNIRSLERQITKPEPYETLDSAYQDFYKVYFNNNNSSCHGADSMSRWDIREIIALNIRPFDPIMFSEIGITKPHLWIDCQDLWHNTPEVLTNIMKFISVPVDSQRWANWLPVMSAWQDIQQRNLKFHYTLDHIVNSIVNNWYYPLEPLTLQQEAIIQHCLIYKHNLNLKNWQLDQFPNNTQDLHRLLEDNTHPTAILYV
jgi:hypothetical protein